MRIVSLLLLLGFTNFVAGGVEESVLKAAGENRVEIEKALADVPSDQRAGMEFLVRNMPTRDLKSLSAKYLLENTRLAYQSRANDTWAREVPDGIFLDAVLPYASINEQRDDWRADFRERFLPLVKDAKSTSEAAATLNQKIFKQLNVRYSTKRRRADQGPLESIDSGLASCTGLSVLLIDACRSVGVPARFVGTPLWSNNSGNHSWVEIWDDGWHFTGAAEPTGDELNKGWFVNNASKAKRDERRYAIFATTFKKSPTSFPAVWARHINDIPAVNVTDRYTRLRETPKEGFVDSLFSVRDASGERVKAEISIFKSRVNKELVCAGFSNDEGFDSNDHLRFSLKKGEQHLVQAKLGDQIEERVVTPETEDEVIAFTFTPDSDSQTGASALELLRAAVAEDEVELEAIANLEFADLPLSAEQVKEARQLLANSFSAGVRRDRKEEMEKKLLELDGKKMPFFYKKFGDKPAAGWSLYISMHGGGGAPPRVNDSQWENQKRLYKLEEGIYLAPRAPTDTWNLWHQRHIDTFFARLVENLVAFEGVDPNRVYIMGYSAGGDGVYQLAPRMADRWAAAAMMAGHPNETVPLGLRNLPFALQMGGRDAAYKRNEIAKEWQGKLKQLREQDPGGYEHFVKIYPNKGHWMGGEDKIAIPWMAKYSRNPVPSKIVWKQDDVTHSHFYWLGVDSDNTIERSEVVAEASGQTITVAADKVKKLHVYVDDRLVDLDQPIKILSQQKVLYEGQPSRTLKTLIQTMTARGDSNLAFPAVVAVDLL